MNPYSKWIGLAFLWAMPAVARAEPPKANNEPHGNDVYAAKIISLIPGQTRKPRGEAILQLGLWLRQLNDTVREQDPDRPAFHATRGALLAIPGFANFYAERIRKAWEAKEAEPDVVKRTGPLLNEFVSEQSEAFRTLGLLPSAESVRVLGEFLYDEKGLVPPSAPGRFDDRRRRQVDVGYSPNCYIALQAMVKLPIVSPPVQPRKGRNAIYGQDIAAWRLWYEQIKEGTRTFRFEGDPREYNLQGPVESKAGSVNEGK